MKSYSQTPHSPKKFWMLNFDFVTLYMAVKLESPIFAGRNAPDCYTPPSGTLESGTCLLRDGMFHLHRETQRLGAIRVTRPARQALAPCTRPPAPTSEENASERPVCPAEHQHQRMQDLFAVPAFVRNSSSCGSSISGLSGVGKSDQVRLSTHQALRGFCLLN